MLPPTCWRAKSWHQKKTCRGSTVLSSSAKVQADYCKRSLAGTIQSIAQCYHAHFDEQCSTRDGRLRHFSAPGPHLSRPNRIPRPALICLRALLDLLNQRVPNLRLRSHYRPHQRQAQTLRNKMLLPPQAHVSRLPNHRQAPNQQHHQRYPPVFEPSYHFSSLSAKSTSPHTSMPALTSSPRATQYVSPS